MISRTDAGFFGLPDRQRIESRLETGRACREHVNVPCNRRGQIVPFDEPRSFERTKPLRQHIRAHLRNCSPQIRETMRAL